MSVFLISNDSEACQLLCSALERRHVPNAYTGHLPDVIEPEWSVVVADAAIEGTVPLLEKLRSIAPWTRSYLMTSSAGPRAYHPFPVIHKPFDAAAFAQTLTRDSELSTLDKRGHTAQTQADELGLLVQTSFEAIVGLDKDLQIVSWNAGASEIYGYTEAEVIGKRISTLSQGDCEQQHIGNLARGQRRAVEVYRKRRDGVSLTVLVSRTRVRANSPGSRLEYAEVSLNLTERRRLERELAHSRRLANLGRLSATMSHEINNPLAVIRSCASWLSDHAKQQDHDDLRDTAEDLELASDRIASFVGQMCGFARRSPSRHHPIPLEPTLELALRMVKPRALSKAVELNTTGRFLEPRTLHHDPERLSQALMNIVANAIDAAAEGEQNVWVDAHINGDCMFIEVADDGPGIDPEIRDHLFEPFATTKPFGQGTGLGLALTLEVAREHKGTVQFEERAEGGTRAILRLPLNGPERPNGCDAL